MFRALFLGSFFLLLFLTPTLSHAMSPIVGCGFDEPCDACDFFTLISNAMKWLVALITLVITLVVVWSGIRIATAGGNMGTVKEARSMFTNAVVGFAILLCAWLIIDTLMKTFLDQGKIGRPWNTISADACQTPKATGPTAPAGGGTTTGGDVPVPEPPYNGSAGGKIVAFAQAADAKQCQYNQDKRNGCTGNPGYTDCSNLVETAYKSAGCRSPGGTTAAQYPNASPLEDKNSLRTGDSLVYRHGDKGHVVICMADGCDQVIHASGVRDGIKISNSSYYLKQPGVRVIRVSKYCSS